MKPDNLRVALVFFCDICECFPDMEGTRRLDKAIELYQNSEANKVMITGGGRQNAKLGQFYFSYLREKEIPEKDIILELNSASTSENVHNCSDMLGSLESSGIVIENIWLISNFRHLRRINLIRKRVYWPWPTKNDSVKLDENISPRLLEAIKLLATIFDPDEKSWHSRRFKKKRTEQN